MSEKIEIIKKTSQERLAQLFKKSEEAKAQLKIIDEKIKTIKNEESKIERKERVNKLIEIAAMLVGDNWKKAHGMLIANPGIAEKFKKENEL